MMVDTALLTQVPNFEDPVEGSVFTHSVVLPMVMMGVPVEERNTWRVRGKGRG